MYKIFLCTVIIRRILNVIFNHLLSVILGFIPRIHAKSTPMDTRVKPEYDNRKRLYTTPENDNLVTQCGRSMIEMLGVLAIIGVLSVGGITGYSKAMEKFKINKTINEISTIASNIQTTFISQTNFSEKLRCGYAYPPCSAGFPLSMIIPDEVKVDKDKNEILLSNNSSLSIIIQGYPFFTLTINKLSKNDCIELATANWNKNNNGLIAVNAKGYKDTDYCDINACYGTNGNETCCPDDEDGWVAVCAKNAPMTIQKALQGCTCTDADCEIIIGFSL